MKRRVVVNPKARIDARRAAEYYFDQGGNDLAHRFFYSLEDMYHMLADFPGIGSLWNHQNPNYSGVRRKAVPGFPKYHIFYRATDETLKILHVFHSSRDLSKLF